MIIGGFVVCCYSFFTAQYRRRKKSFCITEQLGFALGAVELTLRDWQGLTPEEWTAVADSYATSHEMEMHDGWERMRMLATITIQPHVKNRLTPDTLLPLPWDNDQTQTTQAAHVPPVGKDEARERLVSLMKGLKD